MSIIRFMTLIGPPGLIGPVGLKGNLGPVGAPGIDGFSGRDGEKGDRGFQGKLERKRVTSKCFFFARNFASIEMRIFTHSFCSQFQ